MRVNFAYKLYLPILLITAIVGVFAYNMTNISSLVNKELKSANKKEFLFIYKILL